MNYLISTSLLKIGPVRFAEIESDWLLVEKRLTGIACGQAFSFELENLALKTGDLDQLGLSSRGLLEFPRGRKKNYSL